MRPGLTVSLCSKKSSLMYKFCVEKYLYTSVSNLRVFSLNCEIIVANALTWMPSFPKSSCFPSNASVKSYPLEILLISSQHFPVTLFMITSLWSTFFIALIDPSTTACTLNALQSLSSIHSILIWISNPPFVIVELFWGDA